MTVGPTLSGWHVALRTDAGRRDGNQDSVLSMRLPDGSLVVAVADGMGGLELGDVASRTALETLRHAMSRESTLADAVRQANRAVRERAQGRPMGTTLVAAHAVAQRVTVVNVGDSRAYRMTPLGLLRISTDHNHREEARLLGSGPALEVGGRWANALTRSLGARDEVEVDVFGPFDLDEDEGLLLCSDGVHGVLADARIEEWSHSIGDPDEAAEKLIELALANGSEDNLSAVILLRRPSPGAAPPVVRRQAPRWNPQLLVDRSPVSARVRGGRRTARFVTLALLLIVALGAAWYLTR